MIASIDRRILVTALAGGILGDLLLHDGPMGLGFGIWIAVTAAMLIAIIWRAERRLPPSAAAWLAVATLAAFTTAWRNAPELRLLDLLATITALGGAALVASGYFESLARTSIERLLRGALRFTASIAAGAAPLLISEITTATRRENERRDRRVVVRSVAIGLVLLLVFGSLLRAGDPIFASFVVLPDFDIGIAIGHVVLTAVLAWWLAGWSRSAIMPCEPAAAPITPRFLGMTEITTALGVLTALFATYVATQVAYFFGGEQFLRAHTGLTAANYARSGFFQMIWIVVLVLPVLLGTRATMHAGAAIERRHTTLALPLIGLLAVMIASAAWRMRMYVQFYGLTTERFYPLVFMAWLALVLLLICFTVLRDRNGFVLGCIVSGFVALGALNALDPDRFVAQVNLARAERVGFDTLDVAHLSDLRGGAVELATSVVVDDRRAVDAEQRCTAARRLLARWGATSAPARGDARVGAWRYWNFDDARAIRAVREHASQLRAVTHRACAQRSSR